MITLSDFTFGAVPSDAILRDLEVRVYRNDVYGYPLKRVIVRTPPCRRRIECQVDLHATVGLPEAVADYLSQEGWLELSRRMQHETCRIAYIDSIDVAPQLQGRGYGSAMLLRVLPELRNLGVCKVYLHMAPHPGMNKALSAFYHLHGFAPTFSADGFLIMVRNLEAA